MKYLKKFNQLNEDLSQEEIQKQHRNERTFLRNMISLSKSILSEEESEDIEHPANDILSTLILRVYDDVFYKKANTIGLDDSDYASAIEMVKNYLEKQKSLKGYAKELLKYTKRKEKENIINSDDEIQNDDEAQDSLDRIYSRNCSDQHSPHKDL